MKNRFQIKNMRVALMTAGMICGIASSYAATTSTSFQVSANVNARCTVSATDLGFGAVDPTGGDVDNSSTVTVRCTKNSPYTVGLTAGATSGSSFTTRLMGNGADTMQYNLYTNAGRSAVWTNSSPGWASGTGAGMGSAQDLVVYGRVPGGQSNLAVGSYLETAITVTVTY